MNHLKYASRQIFKPRVVNIVKLISLSLGLAIGGMMFTAIAYNYTFDTFYDDTDRICIVYADYVSGDLHSRNNFAFAPDPLGPAAESEINEVESTTRFMGPNTRLMKCENSDSKYGLRTIRADKNYFLFFHLPITSGHISNFPNPGSIFISDSKASEMFLSSDVVGKSIIDEYGNVYTIEGTFKDFPYNTSWEIDAISYAAESVFSKDWLQNHWCNTFLKLNSKSSIKSVEGQLATLQSRHYNVEEEKSKGRYVTLTLNPLRWHHNDQGSANNANIIVFVMGLAILLISSLNYVLLTISSINSRAKEIGVHKCNGASKWSIFRLIFDETLIYVVLALLLGFLFLLSARKGFETLTSAPLIYIFNYKNLYAVGITVLIILLVAGLIPAKFFSTIPVTQVFKNQSNKRTPWKRALLFTQLFSSVFILSFMIIVIRQNNLLFTANHGINMDNIVFTVTKNVPLEKLLSVRNELERNNNVSSVSISSNIPLDYPSGGDVVEAGSNISLFSTREITCDDNFINTYEIPLLYGSFIENTYDTTSVVVNEKFIETAGISPSQAVGSHFMYNGKLLTIKGVVRDFHICNMKILEQFPLILAAIGEQRDDKYSYKMSISLREVSAESISDVNTILKDLFPVDSPTVRPYKDELFRAYQGEVNQKKIVSVAAIIILILTFIGVISYVSSEVNRRRQEMAIRRIHGATINDILILISRGVLYYTFAAAITGSIFAVVIANKWQEDFFIKTTLSPMIFIIVSLILIITVTATIIIQSLKIVSANPSDIVRNPIQ